MSIFNIIINHFYTLIIHIYKFFLSQVIIYILIGNIKIIIHFRL
nr:MAG TPA: hypothetical protein [Bacteriophage sp.]